jgi:hypothetical protein
MESLVSFKIVLEKALMSWYHNIDYGKCGFIQDCFGAIFDFLIIGIDYGKCSFIQDCFGESFNVMII